MNPIIFLFLISLLSKARTRRDKIKAMMVKMTVIAQQNGHANLAMIRRMARCTSHDALLVHLLACLREVPTGVNDPHNSDMIIRILYGNEIQFRRMFRVSRNVSRQSWKNYRLTLEMVTLATLNRIFLARESSNFSPNGRQHIS